MVWGGLQRRSTDNLDRVLELLEFALSDSTTVAPADVVTIIEDVIETNNLLFDLLHLDSVGYADFDDAVLDLHIRAVTARPESPERLVDWLIWSQTRPGDACPLFELADYAPALGEVGMSMLRSRLAVMAADHRDNPVAELDRSFADSVVAQQQMFRFDQYNWTPYLLEHSEREIAKVLGILGESF